MEILILDKIGFEFKSIIGDKEGYYLMIKGIKFNKKYNNYELYLFYNIV